MDFRSDNVTRVSPEILASLSEANNGTVASYGDDPWTVQLQERMRRLFETDCLVFPVLTGTAANCLALASIVPPWGITFAHHHSHLEEDECGAPEFFTRGAKLRLLPGAHGKIEANSLRTAIAASGIGVQHHSQAAAVSISQATEAGSLYQPDEISDIAAATHDAGLYMHMDGARFANAVAALDVAPADITWRSGVDVLSFGATKNGAMMAEAVVFFDVGLAKDFIYRRKQAGHLVSKMRFVSAQLNAYLDHDLWLRNARHANAVAERLGARLAQIPGVEILHPVEANEVFVRMPQAALMALESQGAQFYRWGVPDSGEIRLVTAFDTPMEWVDSFADAVCASTGARLVASA